MGVVAATTTRTPTAHAASHKATQWMVHCHRMSIRSILVQCVLVDMLGNKGLGHDSVLWTAYEVQLYRTYEVRPTETYRTGTVPYRTVGMRPASHDLISVSGGARLAVGVSPLFSRFCSFFRSRSRRTFSRLSGAHTLRCGREAMPATRSHASQPPVTRDRSAKLNH